MKLVNSYAELKVRRKEFVDEIGLELEKLEEALFAFAEKEKVEVVFGSKNKVRIKETETVKFPYKNSKERDELEKLLKEKGLWNEVDQLDTAALNRILDDKKIDENLIKKINKFLTVEKGKRAFISKI